AVDDRLIADDDLLDLVLDAPEVLFELLSLLLDMGDAVCVHGWLAARVYLLEILLDLVAVGGGYLFLVDRALQGALSVLVRLIERRTGDVLSVRVALELLHEVRGAVVPLALHLGVGLELRVLMTHRRVLEELLAGARIRHQGAVLSHRNQFRWERTAPWWRI